MLWEHPPVTPRTCLIDQDNKKWPVSWECFPRAPRTPALNGRLHPGMGKKPEIHKPGEPTPESGLWKIVGPRGGDTGETSVSEKSKPLPPTDKRFFGSERGLSIPGA